MISTGFMAVLVSNIDILYAILKKVRARMTYTPQVDKIRPRNRGLIVIHSIMSTVVLLLLM